MSFFSSLRFPSRKQKETSSNNSSSTNLSSTGNVYKQPAFSASSLLQQKQKQQRERELQQQRERELQLQQQRDRELQHQKERELQLQQQHQRELQQHQRELQQREREMYLQQQQVLQQQKEMEFQQQLHQKRSRMYLNQQASSSKTSVKSRSQPSAPAQQPQSMTLEAMFLSEPFVSTSLVKGSFKTIVKLPKYVDLKEWVALNVFEFYTNLAQFHGVIQEYITPEQYPTMNAGPGVDYLWLDANNKNIILPAHQYIDLALSWISNKINDRNLFPTSNGIPFANNFPRDVQRIMIQMFRIIAHIYYHHFDKIVHLSLEAHWNSFFAHFISFVNEYRIIDKRELLPLNDLIGAFEKQGRIIT